VERFLATRGESRLVTLRTERDEASANLEFESAAAIHAQVQKAEAVRALAPELVRPLSQLRAVILQASAESDEVAVFLFEGGRLGGPAGFSTLGMRIQNEQSGSSSLFAQPMLLEPVPEEQGPGTSDQGTGSKEQGAAERKQARTLLEARLDTVLADLAGGRDASSATMRSGHLALLKRWYYRPEAKRPGEIFFSDEEGRWPVKAILRGVGRIAAKSLTAVPSS
jgi:excinuclease ABC subunit C